MIRENKVKQKLEAGEPLLMCFLCSNDPNVAELLVLNGVDIVVIDNEHMQMDGQQITNIARAVTALDGCCMLRTTEKDSCRIGRFMDCGLSGIVATMTTGFAAAKSVRDGVKYAPIGKRGLSTDGRAAHYGCSAWTPAEYMTFSNRNTMLFLTLEDPDAIKELDQIATLEGIDGIHIGPMDLSNAMGYAGNSQAPEVQALLQAAQAKIASYGDPSGNSWLGAYAPSADKLAAVIAAGNQVINIGSELSILAHGIQAYRDARDICITK